MLKMLKSFWEKFIGFFIRGKGKPEPDSQKTEKFFAERNKDFIKNIAFQGKQNPAQNNYSSNKKVGKQPAIAQVPSQQQAGIQNPIQTNLESTKPVQSKAQSRPKQNLRQFPNNHQNLPQKKSSQDDLDLHQTQMNNSRNKNNRNLLQKNPSRDDLDLYQTRMINNRNNNNQIKSLEKTTGEKFAEYIGLDFSMLHTSEKSFLAEFLKVVPNFIKDEFEQISLLEFIGRKRINLLMKMTVEHPKLSNEILKKVSCRNELDKAKIFELTDDYEMFLFAEIFKPDESHPAKINNKQPENNIRKPVQFSVIAKSIESNLKLELPLPKDLPEWFEQNWYGESISRQELECVYTYDYPERPAMIVGFKGIYEKTQLENAIDNSELKDDANKKYINHPTDQKVKVYKEMITDAPKFLIDAIAKLRVENSIQGTNPRSLRC